MIQREKTVYRGQHFRFRVEARWAVFFDVLGIEWEYLLEGYLLPSGPYLPAFWLPTFNGGMFVDVMERDATPARTLAMLLRTRVWMARGYPSDGGYRVADGTGGDGGYIELWSLPDDPDAVEDAMSAARIAFDGGGWTGEWWFASPDDRAPRRPSPSA